MSDLVRLLDLARRGSHAGGSGGERRAAALVSCVVENVAGLDPDATSALVEFIYWVQQDPMEARDQCVDRGIVEG